MTPRTWKLEWDERMSVGIPEIDADHKRFLILVNELNHAIMDRLGQGEIQARLQAITEDALQHFAREEALFRKWHYPDADAHAAKHVAIAEALQAIQERNINYGLPSEWIDLGLEVKELLFDHFLTEDQKYAEFHRSGVMPRKK